jgi:ribosome small subunit-dependent GTPase A
VPALSDLGWSPFFEKQVESDDHERAFVPARVVGQERSLYRLWSEAAEWLGEVSGRLRFDAHGRGGLPAVGDWVLVKPSPGDGRAIVHRALARRSRISRKVAGGRVEEQVLAANVDTIFLVTSLNREFNPRRIERALTLAWESGARPVVLLTKADLTADAAAWSEQTALVAVGVPVHVTSAVTGDGLDEVRQHLSPGSTAVLIGSSGVGKSTLINALLGGGRLRTAAVREHDDRGRFRAQAFSSTRPAFASCSSGTAPSGSATRSATSSPWPPGATSPTAGTTPNRAARCCKRWRPASSTVIAGGAITSCVASRSFSTASATRFSGRRSSASGERSTRRYAGSTRTGSPETG